MSTGPRSTGPRSTGPNISSLKFDLNSDSQGISSLKFDLRSTGPGISSLKLDPTTAQNLAGALGGIDVDQLMVLGPHNDPSGQNKARQTDATIQSPHAIKEIWNRDGSKAEACGNGTRCVIEALLQDDPSAPTLANSGIPVPQGLSEKLLIVGPSGPLQGWRHNGASWIVQGTGGPGPSLCDPWVIGAPPSSLYGHLGLDRPTGTVLMSVDMGNPHLVIFSPCQIDTADQAWQRWVHSKSFAQGVNVSVVWPTVGPSAKDNGAPGSDFCVGVRVWERGLGWSAACGTAASAIAYGLTNMPIVQQLLPNVLDGQFSWTAQASCQINAGQNLCLMMPGGAVWVRKTGDGIAHGAKVTWHSAGSFFMPA
jgi:diaminopimelate epimerase